MSKGWRLSAESGGARGEKHPAADELSGWSDEALLAEFRCGNDAAFDVLYTRYRGRILAYLRGMISDPVMAEDVYNTTMYRIYSRLPDEIGPGMFRRYVYKAAFNTCLNANRREANLSRRPPAEGAWNGALSTSVTQINPEDHLSNGQLLSLARSFLEGLPDDRRAAILLYHNDGLTYQEIADILGRPIGTIRWLIHEARAAMAGHLQRHVGIRTVKG